MAPSTDADNARAWSRDGSRLAFLRVSDEGRRLGVRATRSAQPWGIMVANAATGDAREVFRAAARRGSAYWAIVAESQLQWMAGDRMSFRGCVQDGGMCTACPPTAGAPVKLTLGTGEVEFVSTNPDGTRVLYNTNIGDIDRRHVRMGIRLGGCARRAGAVVGAELVDHGRLRDERDDQHHAVTRGTGEQWVLPKPFFRPARNEASKTCWTFARSVRQARGHGPPPVDSTMPPMECGRA